MEDKTILLVEDNHDERNIYATALRHRGFRVLEARNGEEALRMARDRRPDAVVTDIGLPSISGLTLSDILKRSRVTEAIPILAISCLNITAPEAIGTGCRAFLPKPFDPRRLVEEVNRLVNESC